MIWHGPLEAVLKSLRQGSVREHSRFTDWDLLHPKVWPCLCGLQGSGLVERSSSLSVVELQGFSCFGLGLFEQKGYPRAPFT